MKGSILYPSMMEYLKTEESDAYTRNQIAEMYEVSPSTVKEYRHSLGKAFLNMPSKHKPLWEGLKSGKYEGMTARQVAESAGMSISAVKRYRQHLGIETDRTTPQVEPWKRNEIEAYCVGQEYQKACWAGDDGPETGDWALQGRQWNPTPKRIARLTAVARRVSPREPVGMEDQAYEIPKVDDRRK